MEPAGVLLKRSAEAGDPSEGAGAANRSAPNRSLTVDYSQKIKQKYYIYTIYTLVSFHLIDIILYIKLGST